MTTHRPIFVLTASLLAVVLSADPAGAGFTTSSVSTSPVQGTTDYNQFLAASVFDKTLGTLNSVSISMADTGFFGGSVTNSSATAQDFTVTENINLTLTQGVASILTDKLSYSQAYTALAPGATSPFGSSTTPVASSAGPLTFSSGAIFDAFNSQTQSSVALHFSTQTSTTTVGGGGNNRIAITTTAGSVVTIGYTYTPAGSGGNPGGTSGGDGGGGTPSIPAPEPASLVMTALGGLLVIATRRARRPRAA